jgi:hypothetical protein
MRALYLELLYVIDYPAGLRVHNTISLAELNP